MVVSARDFSDYFRNLSTPTFSVSPLTEQVSVFKENSPCLNYPVCFSTLQPGSPNWFTWNILYVSKQILVISKQKSQYIKTLLTGKQQQQQNLCTLICTDRTETKDVTPFRQAFYLTNFKPHFAWHWRLSDNLSYSRMQKGILNPKVQGQPNH